MAEWEVGYPIDYSPNGDDIDRFSQKVLNEYNRLYMLLNRLRNLDASAGQNVSDSVAYQFHIDTATGVLYIRNADNTDWIEMGRAGENFFGITPENIGAAKSSGTMGTMFSGNSASRPEPGGEVEIRTNDLFLAFDECKIYRFDGQGWRNFLSLRFEDLLDYERYCVARSEVATNGAGKILRLDPETGKGDIDITGSPDRLLGLVIHTENLRDDHVLVYDAAKQMIVNKPRNDWNRDDAAYGEAGKLLIVGANGKITVDTTGSAEQISGLPIDKEGLQDGQVFAYNAERNILVPVDKDVFTEADVTTIGEPGKLVRVNPDGTITGDLDGNALNLAGVPVNTEDASAATDGYALTYDATTGKFILEPKTGVGAGATLYIYDNNGTVAEYNGSHRVEVSLQNAVDRIASASVKHLDRLVADLYLMMEARGLTTYGYDGMIIENFLDASTIDTVVALVTSVVSGDDSVDVEDASGLIIGAYYQLTDGNFSEEVRIASINISGPINRVIFEEEVRNDYANGRAQLYRSTIYITDGKAYGSGGTYKDVWASGHTFTGSDTSVPLASVLSCNEIAAFQSDKVEEYDGGLTVRVINVNGIALAAEGGGNGSWMRIDRYGNALA